MISEAEWEFLEVPRNAQSSCAGGGAMDDSKQLPKPKKDEKDRLCGYLWKQGAVGLIKSWKNRWFVYDSRRCLLYYYRRPHDMEPLGQIDIANATFSFFTEESERPQFQICHKDRIYNLQAEDQVTMMFWMQELQARRREYSCLQSASAGGNLQKQTSVPSSGLITSKVAYDSSENDPGGFNKPVEKPNTVGNQAAMPKGETGWNFSFTKMNKEFKNWRKSTAITGDPLFQEFTAQEAKDAADGKGNEKLIDIDDSSEAKPERRIDFGFSRLTNSIRNRMPISPTSPTISSPMVLDKSKSCQECVETSSMISVLKEAIAVAEKEISTRDDVIQSLHEQLRFASYKTTRNEDEEASVEHEHYIQQLSRMVKSLSNELNFVKIQYKEKDNAHNECLQQIKVLREMLQAKDNSIIELTNRIWKLEQPAPCVGVLEEAEEATLVKVSGDEDIDYEQLKESVKAIKQQNDFLNSEILELNKLRENDAELMKTQTDQIEKADVEMLRLKSKYLWLLKEFSTPKQEGTADAQKAAEMVEHLLEDALNETTTTSNNRDSVSLADARYSDRYGFYDVATIEDEQSLEDLAERLDVMSDEKEHGTIEMSNGVKWENYLVGIGNQTLTKTLDLKNLVRAGIPHEYRPKVWSDLVSGYVVRDRDHYGPGYYQALLREKEGQYNPSVKQIELDLLRTLPNNKFYDRSDSEGTAKLRRLLRAYSFHNPSVGYCQGLNRLGAIVLLFLDEESAFWTLVAIIEHLMPPDYYTKSLIGAQTDQRVLKDLLELKLPKLNAHFQSLGFDMSLIAFNWFLTIFVDIFPIESVMRTWDVFLYEGSKVLFRYALAVFKTFEEDILEMKDAGPIFAFFRRVPKKRMNARKMYDIGFQQMNPLPMRKIEALRRLHRPILQEQLDEFERCRSEYRSKKSNSSSYAEEETLVQIS